MDEAAQPYEITALAPPVARVARMGDRVVAIFLELFILLPLFWFEFALIAVKNGVFNHGNATLEGGPALLSMLLDILIWLTYHFLSEYFFAGSPGKLVMSIEVRTQQGDHISMKQSLVRNLLRPIDAIGFYALGFIVAVCSEQSRRIGDMAAKTLVVEQTEPHRRRALISYLVLLTICYGAAHIFLHFAH